MAESSYEDARLTGFGGVQFELLNLSLAELGDPLELELVISRCSPLSVEWSAGRPPGDARSLRLEAKSGEDVIMLRQYGDGFTSIGEFSIGGPATPVHYVREGSYDVVLLRGDVEVERFSVVLEGAGQQTIVH
ncbi:MAG: hypothetical protein ACI80K_000916 [Paracoccaceae bacterium]|jgi:hypothetical protein